MTHTNFITTSMVEIVLSISYDPFSDCLSHRGKAGIKIPPAKVHGGLKTVYPLRVRRRGAIPSPVITEASVLAYLLSLSTGSSRAMFVPLRAPILNFARLSVALPAGLLLPFIAFRGGYSVVNNPHNPSGG
jgi:hypothetical protein